MSRAHEHLSDIVRDLLTECVRAREVRRDVAAPLPNRARRLRRRSRSNGQESLW
jgi:hypothetical protein